VVADATQLHQVLVNLCVNARDAMPRGGKLSLFAENVTLAESALRDQPEARPGPYVMLGVSDTGTGIAPELMDRIFDPFFTTKDLGKGTGLGLSTVLGIVRSHAGFVAVESRIGAGSTFRVYLPASTPAETAERTTPQSEPLPSGQGELILVVDDEEAIRESTRLALETHNYRALTASNGKEAVTRFLQHRQSIRLVLTDMMMPEMGGTALIRALRLLNPAVRVVATSGLQPDGNQEELEKLGIKEVLPKPCGPRALLEAVRRQLA
jgi:CheY-like chemotaxis protein